MDYAQELCVNFIRVESCAIVINVRGFEKRLETSIEEVERIKEMGFVEGEKVKFFYSDKTNWEIKKLNLDITREKYFGRDE